MPNIEPNGNPNTFLTNLNLRAHSRFSSQLQQQDTQITSQTTNQLNWEPSIPPYRHKPATKSPPSFEDNNSSTGQTASSRTAERTSENVTARQRGRRSPHAVAVVLQPYRGHGATRSPCGSTSAPRPRGDDLDAASFLPPPIAPLR